MSKKPSSACGVLSSETREREREEKGDLLWLVNKRHGRRCVDFVEKGLRFCGVEDGVESKWRWLLSQCEVVMNDCKILCLL